MAPRDVQNKRRPQTGARARRTRGARLLAAASLLAAIGGAVAIILSTTGSSGSNAASTQQSSRRLTTSTASAAKPGTAAVPILAYHVINSAPPTSGASPDLYVPVAEFTAQMNALKAAGWHAITLNQLEANWSKGTALPPGKPIVVTFDDGYASQATNALPILKQLGWIAVANIQSNPRSPTDGGLTDAQVNDLIAAGWEIDAEGNSQPDLTSLGQTEVSQTVKTERQALQSHYKLPVNGYSYPSGRYNAEVAIAARDAGFVGATTLVDGWAGPQSDRFRLPRLRVTGGTSPSALLSRIAAVAHNPPPPDASPGI